VIETSSSGVRKAIWSGRSDAVIWNASQSVCAWRAAGSAPLVLAQSTVVLSMVSPVGRFCLGRRGSEFVPILAAPGVDRKPRGKVSLHASTHPLEGVNHAIANLEGERLQGGGAWCQT
jgi:hypothetical protein